MESKLRKEWKERKCKFYHNCYKDRWFSLCICKEDETEMAINLRHKTSCSFSIFHSIIYRNMTVKEKRILIDIRKLLLNGERNCNSFYSLLICSYRASFCYDDNFRNNRSFYSMNITCRSDSSLSSSNWLLLYISMEWISWEISQVSS